HVRLVEVPRDHAFVDLARVDPTLCGQPGNLPDGVGDLGAPAVVDAHGQVEHVVVPGLLLGDLQLADHAAPQPWPAPGPPDPHAHRVHLVHPAADDVAVEAHEEAHLVRAASPVLGRERVRREPADADVDA